MARKTGLGETEERILLALWRRGGETHGAAIQEELERTIGVRLSIAAIHYTLMRLEEKAQVDSLLGDPLPVRGGKARRLFRLLPAGRRALRRSRDEVQALWEGLEEAPGSAPSE